MGPIWGRQDPGGPHVGPMNLAIWAVPLTSMYGYKPDYWHFVRGIKCRIRCLLLRVCLLSGPHWTNGLWAHSWYIVKTTHSCNHDFDYPHRSRIDTYHDSLALKTLVSWSGHHFFKLEQGVIYMTYMRQNYRPPVVQIMFQPNGLIWWLIILYFDPIHWFSPPNWNMIYSLQIINFVGDLRIMRSDYCAKSLWF